MGEGDDVGKGDFWGRGMMTGEGLLGRGLMLLWEVCGGERSREVYWGDRDDVW